jgi:hypothetical protein
LSHPQDYREGDQKYLSSIPRCEHSVFWPRSARSDKNPACGICTQPRFTGGPISYRKLKIVDREIPIIEDQPEAEDSQELNKTEFEEVKEDFSEEA